MKQKRYHNIQSHGFSIQPRVVFDLVSAGQYLLIGKPKRDRSMAGCKMWFEGITSKHPAFPKSF